MLDSLLVGNALHCFKLMRRIVTYLNPIIIKRWEIKDGAARSALNRVRDMTTRRGSTDWPRREEDVSLAALALARIQYAYQIDVGGNQNTFSLDYELG